MRPERLAREPDLGAFLRHELMHLQDMIDPAFGYVPELPVLGPSLNQQRLARERYRRLWDVTIDGRLTRNGQGAMATRSHRWSEFRDTFAGWPEPRQQEAFDSLWTHCAPTHSLLVQLACDPVLVQPASGPRQGALCPLCGFPTFAWADETGLLPDAIDRIRAEFPLWLPQHGSCARCAAIYRANRPQFSTAL